MNRVRLHLIRTLWSHWGAHAGIVRYLDHLAPGEFEVSARATLHEDESAPGPRRPVWSALRAAVRRRGMAWYTLYDLRSEVSALPRILAGSIDVLHYLDPEHGMQYLPLLRHRLPLARVRLLATFHQPPMLLSQVVRRDVVERLDHITVVSPDQEEYFRSVFPAVPVTLILHGVDSVFFTPSAAPAVRDTWTCLTVGHNLRDFAVLRRVAEQMRDDRSVRFIVVTNRGRDFDGLPNVAVYSGLSDEGLRDVYRSADVLLLPLLGATANNALLEAFACGLPVVTTDLPSIRAYAPAGEAVLVPCGDDEGLIAALWRVRSDPDYRARLRASARRRAEALDWARIAPRYAAVYHNVEDVQETIAAPSPADYPGASAGGTPT